MDQQLKELCIKCEADSNLEVCLGKYTKPRLKQILDVYGVKMPSAAKKQEMAAKAEEAIKENVISFFNGEGADRKSDMQEIITNGMTLTAADDLSAVKDFIERGLVYLTAAGDSAEAVVPVNIKAIMALVDEEPQAPDGRYDSEGHPVREPSGERTEQDAEVIKYAAALANIYGVYPGSQLKEIWDFNHRHAISPRDIVSALEKSGDSDGFYISESYVITSILKNMELYINLLTRVKTADVYYYPSEEVIEEFAAGPAIKPAPEYYILRSYLTGKLQDEEKAEALIEELYIESARDAEDTEIIAFVTSRGVSFSDSADQDRFMYLYTCWSYELRIWTCKGYKPSELREEKLQNRNFNRSDRLGSPKLIRMMGRNDACPCGSGKKYKKCCMKYAE